MRICHPSVVFCSSAADCQKKCDASTSVCILPKQPGLCKAYIPRYYYDSKLGMCKKFIYGGCGANGNNFV